MASASSEEVNTVARGLGTEAHKSDGDVLVISREVFESRMLNVAFDSWDGLKLATADAQPRMPRTAHAHGESATVVRLDPVRVFGWVATLLINICVFGWVSYMATWNLLLGFASVVVYGAVLWWLIKTSLAKALAGVLWPILPCTVGAAGFFVAYTLHPDQPDDRAGIALLLGLVIAPHTLVAAQLLRGLPEDPDRATLSLNLFLGVWAAALASFALLLPPSTNEARRALSNFSSWSLLLLGLAAVAAAGRLLVVPSIVGSDEIISWALNLGVLGVFVASQMVLHIPWSSELWRWLLFAMLMPLVGLLGAIFGRSLPVLLSAIGYFMIVIYASTRFSELAEGLGASNGLCTFVGLGTFGGFGMAVVVVVQCLWQSSRFKDFIASVQRAHAQAYSQAMADDSRSPLSLPLGPQEGVHPPS